MFWGTAVLGSYEWITTNHSLKFTNIIKSNIQ